jgi:hypothetical protein
LTSQDFRCLALSFPETSENSHMDHPDFRVGGKIFAALGYPEDGWAMVKLTPIEQEMFVKAQPKVFNPCTGGWGRRGATNVRLKAARKLTLRRALEAAWRLAAPEKLPVNSTRIAKPAVARGSTPPVLCT